MSRVKIRFGNFTLRVHRDRVNWYRWYYGMYGAKVRIVR